MNLFPNIEMDLNTRPVLKVLFYGSMIVIPLCFLSLFSGLKDASSRWEPWQSMADCQLGQAEVLGSGSVSSVCAWVLWWLAGA